MSTLTPNLGLHQFVSGDSFGSFYLKCITPKNAAEDCDNWMYLVNGVAPSVSLDNVILSALIS